MLMYNLCTLQLCRCSITLIVLIMVAAEYLYLYAVLAHNNYIVMVIINIIVISVLRNELLLLTVSCTRE